MKAILRSIIPLTMLMYAALDVVAGLAQTPHRSGQLQVASTLHVRGIGGAEADAQASSSASLDVEHIERNHLGEPVEPLSRYTHIRRVVPQPTRDRVALHQQTYDHLVRSVQHQYHAASPASARLSRIAGRTPDLQDQIKALHDEEIVYLFHSRPQDRHLKEHLIDEFARRTESAGEEALRQLQGRAAVSDPPSPIARYNWMYHVLENLNFPPVRRL
ncbi:uncharacterized protein PFL1_06813 [Pseudozyma flocculosa PF-1]|uniref:Uncharacterized protein n=2 Tax=Pseudozyma flocculosa TaxID=84751 RepID=A0A5C3F3N0_9BASI|nr:uncharacterized protein PFL1_06813 [Pseudozyma flocculosa PF-1]EPQ25633.1 hypothetical protein PFL1_06813 [Pseudozyma flocculosa PF-1]SPO38546.1 uncharacterized protein PSFLO_04024 [Pseudozyma flocculosa]